MAKKDKIFGGKGGVSPRNMLVMESEVSLVLRGRVRGMNPGGRREASIPSRGRLPPCFRSALSRIRRSALVGRLRALSRARCLSSGGKKAPTVKSRGLENVSHNSGFLCRGAGFGRIVTGRRRERLRGQNHVFQAVGRRIVRNVIRHRGGMI